MNAIEVNHLRRVYKTTIGVVRRKSKEVEAVDDVSFGVQPGELLGLLGPNGAGKTTTVKMLTTLLIPTSGTAHILGYDVVRQADKIRPRIGFIFGGERGLYWRLSGIASFFIINPDVQRWQNGLEFPVYILSGFLFPIAMLPGWTTPLSYLLAPYWAARALHSTASGGADLPEVALAWGMMLLFSLLYLFLSGRLFKFILRKARVDATLGMQ